VDGVVHGGDVVVLDRDVLTVPAHHAGVPEELPVGAVRLAAGATVPARSADVVALGGAHALADREVADVPADVDDGAGDLVAEDERHGDPVLEGPVAGDHVVKADATGVDLDDDAPGGRPWGPARCPAS